MNCKSNLVLLTSTAKIVFILVSFNLTCKVKADHRNNHNDDSIAFPRISLKSCCKFQGSFFEGHCNDHKGRRTFPKSKDFKGFKYVIEPGPSLLCEDGTYSRKEIYNVSIYDVHLDGSLELNNLIYSPNNFCIDQIKDLDNGQQLHFTVTICSAKCSSTNPCLKKCCTWEQPSMLHPSFHCSDSIPELGEVSFLNTTKLMGRYENVDYSDQLNRMNFVPDHYPLCDATDTSLRIESNFQILPNGNVKILWGHHTWIELDDYCIESPNLKSQKISKAQTDEKDFIVLYCPSQLYMHIGTFTKIQMIYCGISWIFTLLALIIYLILWRKHSIHGWTQFAFILSAFLYFFMRFIRRNIELANGFRLSTRIVDRVDTFFALGLLANLVNLSFHMFWTFYKIQPERVIRDWKDLKQLYVSVSLCWALVAAIILSELFIVDFDTIITLQVAVLAILLGFNSIFVFATAIIVWKQLRQREKISKTGMDQKKMVILFAKLFCMTGIIWSLKILEQFVRKDSYARGWFWDTVQFITYTYGVVIFVIFVLNDRMISGLQERFPQLQKAISKRKRGYQDVRATTMTPVGSTDQSDALLPPPSK